MHRLHLNDCILYKNIVIMQLQIGMDSKQNAVVFVCIKAARILSYMYPDAMRKDAFVFDPILSNLVQFIMIFKKTTTNWQRKKAETILTTTVDRMCAAKRRR